MICLLVGAPHLQFGRVLLLARQELLQCVVGGLDRVLFNWACYVSSQRRQHRPKLSGRRAACEIEEFEGLAGGSGRRQKGNEVLCEAGEVGAPHGHIALTEDGSAPWPAFKLQACGADDHVWEAAAWRMREQGAHEGSTKWTREKESALRSAPSASASLSSMLPGLGRMMGISHTRRLFFASSHATLVTPGQRALESRITE